MPPRVGLEPALALRGLGGGLTEAMDADRELALNWSYAQEWSEDSTYEQRTEQEARDLFRAVEDPANGVLLWLRAYW